MSLRSLVSYIKSSAEARGITINLQVCEVATNSIIANDLLYFNNRCFYPDIRPKQGQVGITLDEARLVLGNNIEAAISLEELVDYFCCLAAINNKKQVEEYGEPF